MKYAWNHMESARTKSKPYVGSLAQRHEMKEAAVRREVPFEPTKSETKTQRTTNIRSTIPSKSGDYHSHYVFLVHSEFVLILRSKKRGRESTESKVIKKQ